MENIKRYPKSKNNYQCIGPCYQPGTMVVHPTQLEFVTETALPFCPIEQIFIDDPITGEVVKKSTDICYNPIEKNSIDKAQLEINILTPHIDFNSEYFLKIYYNIFSFDDAIDWIENNQSSPLRTKIRIINCAIEIFGNMIELFDVRFSKFFSEYIKSTKIKLIYSQINKYIGLDKNENIMMTNEKNNNLKPNEKIIERTNYIIHTFLNQEEIIKFLQKYFKKYTTSTDVFDDHLEIMGNELIVYILNKIEATLSNK